MHQEVTTDALLTTLERTEIDHETISQEQLDLASKYRSSLLPWRGQFSPELIELFLKHYASAGAKVLDPFVGSGTTLFEASRKGLECYGAEINPSAVELARTAEFVNLTLSARNEVIETADDILRRYIRPLQPTLFDYHLYPEQQNQNYMIGFQDDAQTKQTLSAIIAEAADQSQLQNYLVNVLMRFLGSNRQEGTEGLLRAHRDHATLVRTLPYSNRPCRVLHVDARAIDLPAQSVELVITSPPYINVFNYHQNHRPAMELVGWNLLQVAKSEIGSNRKHRQNRFLTVVQYCMDISAVLRRMLRVMHSKGRAILVVGRESSVRGVSFKNGSLVAALAVGATGFSLASRQERRFRNKFGELIAEDILHLEPNVAACNEDDSYSVARAVAMAALANAVRQASREVCADIEDALQRAHSVQPSPLFAIPSNKVARNVFEGGS